MMNATSEEVIRSSPRTILLLSLVFLGSLRLCCSWLRRCRQGPPGPFAWPIIGNAAQLGNTPHIYFMCMAKEYGNVFQIRLGCRNIVVLNGDSIRNALVKQGPVFAGRPDFTSFKYISNGDSLAFGNVSESWKVHRKLVQSTVRMFSTGNLHTKKTFQHHVLCEMRELFEVLLTKTAENKYFQPMSDLIVSTANIMSAVCFGKRFSYEDEEFRQMLGRNNQFTKTVGAGSIVDVMPWLQYFPNPIKTIFDNFKNLNLEFSMFIRDKVVEHRKTIQFSIIRDITDALILALDHPRDTTSSVCKDYVVPTVGDIFGASQDTLSTALQWIILMLIRFPEIQLRLQQEVDRVVGRSQLPTIEDQQRLPYVMAFIYEVMRFTSFLPLTIPHSTTMDTSFMGYSIPKNTVIFINQWSINRDPAVWTEPDLFNPQRFLDKEGVLNKDLTSTVLIFSLGKRRCIGEDLSKMQMFLFTSLVVHQCNIMSDPSKPPTMDYTYGLTLKPHPFYIAVSLRDNMALLEEACTQKYTYDKLTHPDVDR